MVILFLRGKWVPGGRNPLRWTAGMLWEYLEVWGRVTGECGRAVVCAVLVELRCERMVG